LINSNFNSKKKVERNLSRIKEERLFKSQKNLGTIENKKKVLTQLENKSEEQGSNLENSLNIIIVRKRYLKRGDLIGMICWTEKRKVEGRKFLMR
jgi:hypothetical protein